MTDETNDHRKQSADRREEISVVIPTYRRATYLRRCINGLLEQVRGPSEIIVVARSDDTESHRAAGEFKGDRVALIVVSDTDVVHAMAAGAAASRGAVVAFVDDDAVPRRDWVARLAAHFEDATVGGVGGRDVIQTEVERARPLTQDIGRITHWGRLIGNHHLGCGRAREVMVLKGVNMAFRREALAFPDGLLGHGTQLHFEIAMSLWVRKAGWRLIYDPAIVVDHFVAPRQDHHSRSRPDPRAVEESAYNHVASLLSLAPSLYWKRALFGLAVGERELPGLARAAYAVVRGDGDTARRLTSSFQGQVRALRAVRKGPVRMATVVENVSGPPPRPVVVLVAHDIHDYGGMERAFSELIRLGGRYVRFRVVAQTLAEDLRAAVDWHRVPGPTRPFPLRFTVFFFLGAMRLASIRCDIRHAMGALVISRVDLTSVQFCHAGYLRSTGSLSPAGAPFPRRLNTAASRLLALVAERWCYRPGRVRAVGVVSRGVGDEVRHHYPGIAVVQTPNGVDVDRLSHDGALRQAVRSQHRAREGDVVAIFVGGDWDRKGLQCAIEGVALARDAGAATVLWVVGRGDDARFGRLAERLGIRDAIRFLGQRADVESLYEGADIFVLPTLYETFCIAAYEAAASGLPIVSTRVSGVVDLVGEDVAGILVERTAESVGEALGRLTFDAELRAGLGREGRQRAASYRWQDSVDATLGVYHRLLSSSPVGRKAMLARSVAEVGKA